MSQRSPTSASNASVQGKSQVRVSQGRLFCRSTGNAEALAFVGVVALPCSIDGEAMRNFHLKAGLWLDTTQAVDPWVRMEYLERSEDSSLDARKLGEMDANDLFGQLSFFQRRAPDAVEMFVRRTHLAHDDPDITWSLVLGIHLKRPSAMPIDGLYEVQSKGLQLIDRDLHTGTHPGYLLRLPLWGDEGRFGMATSMEPRRFPLWAQENRPNIKDTHFQAYVAEMEKIAPMPMVYTLQEQIERKQLGTKVMHRIRAQESARAAAHAPSRQP